MLPWPSTLKKRRNVESIVGSGPVRFKRSTARAAGEKAMAEGAAGADEGNDFVQRRLSVHDVFDEQWDEEETAAEEEEAPVEPVG